MAEMGRGAIISCGPSPQVRPHDAMDSAPFLGSNVAEVRLESAAASGQPAVAKPVCEGLTGHGPAPMIRSHEFPPVRRSAAYRCTVYGPFSPCGGGETVLPVKQLKEWRLSGLDETVCYDLEFRAHGAVPSWPVKL